MVMHANSVRLLRLSCKSRYDLQVLLTGSVLHVQVLVDACLRHFQRTQNPATLPAALAGMPKEQIVGLLPKLLEPAALFSQCLSRILLTLPTGATCCRRHVLRMSRNTFWTGNGRTMHRPRPQQPVYLLGLKHILLSYHPRLPVSTRATFHRSTALSAWRHLRTHSEL